MALLNFKGKNAVWNHHLSVPYQILEKSQKLSVKGKNEDENLIIEADNLVALKSLLPKYQGRIKCIYIDPPYNTGNENWVYNDKSNSPQIRDWIGKTVGADDLTRHDKWLCMMTPRLKLLRELLRDDGVIFISINDNEFYHLRILLEEIFQPENFVATFVWKTRQATGKQVAGNNVSTEHEYVLCYGKTKTNVFKGVLRDRSQYSNPDKDPRGDWAKHPLDVGSTKEERPNCFYDLIDPVTKNLYKANPNRVWAFVPSSMNKLISEGKIIFDPKGKNRPSLKKFWNELRTETKPVSTWIGKNGDDEAVHLEVGYNTEGTKLLNDIFEGKIFDYPKPVSLLKSLIEQVTDENSIILDSFAGSGTTAHAVIDLNKRAGNRKFILVQLPEKIKKNTPAFSAGFRWVHEITRERVKRVIDKDKLGVGFTYMQLGHQIDAESILSGTLPSYKEFAKYVYYLATGKTIDSEETINENNYYVGKVDGESVYLIYVKDKNKLKNLAITLEWAEKVSQKDKSKKLVYAPACFLDEEYLDKLNISFISIPYNLFEKTK